MLPHAVLAKPESLFLGLPPFQLYGHISGTPNRVVVGRVNSVTPSITMQAQRRLALAQYVGSAWRELQRFKPRRYVAGTGRDPACGALGLWVDRARPCYRKNTGERRQNFYAGTDDWLICRHEMRALVLLAFAFACKSSDSLVQLGWGPTLKAHLPPPELSAEERRVLQRGFLRTGYISAPPRPLKEQAAVAEFLGRRLIITLSSRRTRSLAEDHPVGQALPQVCLQPAETDAIQRVLMTLEPWEPAICAFGGGNAEIDRDVTGSRLDPASVQYDKQYRHGLAHLLCSRAAKLLQAAVLEADPLLAIGSTVRLQYPYGPDFLVQKPQIARG
eukprot:SAG31_NODE_6732_length_1907_cov_1.478429_3_plen_330_part_01